MHDNIKTFSLDGEVADTNLVFAKETLVRSLDSQMRDEGYAPVWDIDPQFTLDYRPNEGKYLFQLTIYGIYVGEDKAWQVGGMIGGKMMISSPKTKSTQS